MLSMKLTSHKLHLNADLIGSVSSFLCLIHCLLTPFLFVAQTCSVANCSDAPLAWQLIDYLFIGISYLAVKQSIKNSSTKWVKKGLWFSWVLTFIFIINHTFGWLPIPKILVYIPAGALIVLHLYNLKYCQCKEDGCCVQLDV